MDAFAPLFIGFFVWEALAESLKLLVAAFREKDAHWENLATALMGYVFANAIQLNILVEFGYPDLGTDLYWQVSFMTFGLLGMRGSGILHDILKRLSS